MSSNYACINSIYVSAFQFNIFSTQENFHFVRVYDGSNIISSQLLGEYSGEYEAGDVVVLSDSEKMLITFQSDHSDMMRGFNASWTIGAHSNISSLHSIMFYFLFK